MRTVKVRPQQGYSSPGQPGSGCQLHEACAGRASRDDGGGVDNLSTGVREQVNERDEFHEIDLTDHTALRQVFAVSKFDAIIHMAAFAAECLSPFVRRHCYTEIAAVPESRPQD